MLLFQGYREVSHFSTPWNFRFAWRLFLFAHLLRDGKHDELDQGDDEKWKGRLRAGKSEILLKVLLVEGLCRENMVQAVARCSDIVV